MKNEKIVVKINKEILNYETQVVNGLSLRQLISLIIAIIVTVILNFTIGRVLPQMFQMIVYVFGVLPAFIIGFVNINGYPGERAVVMIFNYMRTPKVLKSVHQNAYDIARTKLLEERKKEYAKDKTIRRHGRNTK